MNSLFAYTKFDGDVSDWDVSNVEEFEYTFGNSVYTGTRNVDGVKNYNLSKWNISSATTMMCMFSNNQLFNCDLSSWDLENVETTYMFDGCNIDEINKPQNISEF